MYETTTGHQVTQLDDR